MRDLRRRRRRQSRGERINRRVHLGRSWERDACCRRTLCMLHARVDRLRTCVTRRLLLVALGVMPSRCLLLLCASGKKLPEPDLYIDRRLVMRCLLQLRLRAGGERVMLLPGRRRLPRCLLLLLGCQLLFNILLVADSDYVLLRSTRRNTHVPRPHVGCRCRLLDHAHPRSLASLTRRPRSGLVRGGRARRRAGH